MPFRQAMGTTGTSRRLYSLAYDFISDRLYFHKPNGAVTGIPDVILYSTRPGMSIHGNLFNRHRVWFDCQLFGDSTSVKKGVYSLDIETC